MAFRSHKKPFLTLMGAGAMSQLLLLLISPLLTRLYEPDDFGVYGVFVALCATMAGVSGGRLELAIPVAKRRADATALLVLTVLFAFPLSILLSALVNWLGPIFGLAAALDGEVLIWLPVATFSIVFFQAVNYWLLWNKNYTGAARARWVQGVTMAITQLGAGGMALGSWGLVIGHTMAQFFGALLGAGRKTMRLALQNASQMSWRKRAAILKKHRQYPLVMAPAALLNMLGQHLPVIFIGALFGAKEAGFYVIAQRVCGAPLALLGQSIGQVFAAEAPDLMRRSARNMLPIFAKLTISMLVGGGAFVLLLAVFAPTVVSFVFGDQWKDAGVLMQILGIVFVLEFVVTPVSLTLSFIGHFGRQLWWDVVRLLGILLAFAVAAKFQWGFYDAMVALAIALSLSHAYLLGLMWRGLKKQSLKNEAGDLNASSKLGKD